MDYSNLSYQLTKTISKADKKNNGIYFTPPDTIQRNIDILSPYMDNIQNVLEPACGSCEYISALNNNNNNLNITGIEFNKTIYESIKDLESDNITLLNHDFLAYESPTKYDLIIGNPPYFVLKKNDVDEEYYSYFNGRPNIFILFIIKSLKLLNTNGILSFVLPTGFFNSVYYDKTRHYIADNFKIINIIECNDNYIETQQGTIILIVQKTINESHYINENNKNFILRKNNYTIFGTPDNIKKLKKLYINSKTLHDLNFDVNVGTVVWNQCKSILTDDESKTRLIYSSDISNNQLQIKKYKNSAKKNYIDKEGICVPLLVVNRGYGIGNYNFEYCLINEDFDYLIENHLICIKYRGVIEKDELIELYKKIIGSLKTKKTKSFIDTYFGNSAINTTELNHIVPIYF